ncbi:SLBB domain-containing protein, partial [bacterium]|nr:SLBB domain-containing protein [bacterium]
RSQARQNEPVAVVSVSGAVRAGGNYPLIKGATVETLIDAAGGLTDSAFLQAAELRRLSDRASGEVVADYRDINLSQGAGLELALASRDHLTVRDIPDWSPTDAITVQGEVKFPGEYRIRKGETLSDVINRAGGFTGEASPESAIFAREAVAALEVERAAEFARDVQANFATRLLTEETTTQSIADVSQIVESLQAVEGTGRLLINLPAAMSGDANADIELTDGDTVTIPKLSNTVSVIGEVKRAGTHTFQSELSLDDYVDLSAGFTRRADNGGLYIVKANGSVVTMERNLWRFTGNNEALDPGDTIVVPINTQYKESLASWREITQIVYQSMVSIAAVAAL